MNRESSLAIALATMLAAVAPLWPDSGTAPPRLAADWPASFEGRAITPIAPAPEDAQIARDFPGHIARFTDGRRQIVLRRVATATRRLHPARNCFGALGYDVAPAPMRITGGGRTSSCFEAIGHGRRLLICEQVGDRAGRAFPDIPSWYWPALLGSSRGPWLAAMTVERLS
jgi:hypothetical protein